MAVAIQKQTRVQYQILTTFHSCPTTPRTLGRNAKDFNGELIAHREYHPDCFSNTDQLLTFAFGSEKDLKEFREDIILRGHVFYENEGVFSGEGLCGLPELVGGSNE